MPSFHAVYISPWHCKLLQDDSACYWLTSHFKSFLCASVQLFSHPSGILTPCISFHFSPRYIRQIRIQQPRVHHVPPIFFPPLQSTNPTPSSYRMLQHKPFTSPKALLAAEQGLPPQISTLSLSFHMESRRVVRSGISRYLIDTASWATKQCIIHLFLESRAWPSRPGRIYVHIWGGELL